MRLNRLLFAAALAAALPPSPASAQSGKNLWKPPIAVSTNVSVWRGERINITLRGFHGNNPVQYTIDRTPRHGSLSPVAQPDPDRVTRSTDGSVVYAHDDSEDSMSDEFTFRARGLSGGLSAPATVRITVMDRPPVLAAPSVLDFTAAAGEIVTRSLGLTNAGGGVLELDGRAKPPFEFAGRTIIALGRGESTNVVVRYAPAAAGQNDRQSVRLGVNDSSGAQITLRGASFAPFEVDAPSPDFSLVGQARQAEVVLQSRGTEPQEIAVTFEPAGLVEADSPVRLAAGATAAIALRIPAERKGEGREITATFSTSAYREDVELVAPPVPPELALQTGQLDFTGRGKEAALVVTNSGGVRGRFRIDPVAGLAFAEGGVLDAREFEVEPGRTMTVALRLDVANHAEPPTRLTVKLGAGEPQFVTILAPAPTPTPTPGPRVVLAPTPPPQVPKPWLLGSDIRRVEQADRRGTLEWRTAKQGWREPRLEIASDGRTEPYVAPAPPRAWMDIIGDTISGWFSGLVKAPPPTAAQDDAAVPQEWSAMTIDGAAAQDTARLWVLTAVRESNGSREPASAVFQLDPATRGLKEAAEPPATPAPEVTIPAPDPSAGAAITGRRTIAPALKLEDARASAQRDSATVRIIFPRDAGADGYRLEHGINPAVLDPATGIPYAAEFQPVPHPAEVRILGTSETELEGKKLTVLFASIEGLRAGTSTTWRAVTMAGGQDRWPTGEFIVTTLPPWRFPWRTAFLVAASIALAAVLYLRWRLNRPPH